MEGERFVDVDGCRTRYFEAGSGEPMVLIHGGNMGQFDNVDCAENWRLNWDGFVQNGFHVYAIDKLGQGYTDTPKRDEDWTMAATVRHAYGFVRAVGLDRVHLVGHSRGGYVVTRLTLEHPEAVRTVTVVDSSTTSPVPNVKRGPLLAAAPQPLLSRESIAWVTRQFSVNEILTDDWLEVRERIARMDKNAAAVETMRRLEPQYLSRHEEQKKESLGWIREGRLKTPTLLVWGFNDPSALIQGGYQLFELVAGSAPRSQLHVFNRAGHYSYREHPADFVRVVSAFAQGG